jgi:hypothetical protein
MKFIILGGRFTKRIFGFQIVIGRYIIQYAYGKFGIYNRKSCLWWPK